MKTENLQDKISSERSLPPINPRIPDDSIFDRFAIDHGLPRLEDYRNTFRYRDEKKEKYLSGTLQKVFSAIKTYFQKQKI